MEEADGNRRLRMVTEFPCWGGVTPAAVDVLFRIALTWQNIHKFSSQTNRGRISRFPVGSFPACLHFDRTRVSGAMWSPALYG